MLNSWSKTIRYRPLVAFKEFKRRSGRPQIPELYDGRVVCFRCYTQLSCNVRMPTDGVAFYLQHELKLLSLAVPQMPQVPAFC